MSMDTEAGTRVTELVEALRRYAEESGRMSTAFAREQGLHRTDGAALIAVLRAERAGTPLTAGRLGRELELSSGATTAVVDRLERQGHLRRERDESDRRRVTLHHGDSGALAGQAWFGPLAARVARTVAGYSAEELGLVNRFLDEMTAVLLRHRAELEEPTAGGTR